MLSGPVTILAGPWGTPNDFPTTTNATAVATTSGPATIVCMVAARGHNGSSTPSVVSVAGTGLTFSKLSTGTGFTDGVSYGYTCEIWTADAPAAISNVTITVTVSEGCDKGVTVFAVTPGVIRGTKFDQQTWAGTNFSKAFTNMTSGSLALASVWTNPIGNGASPLVGTTVIDDQNGAALFLRNTDPQAGGTVTLSASNASWTGDYFTGIELLKYVPPAIRGIIMKQGSLGGGSGNVGLWFTYDGQKHGPSGESFPVVGVGNMSIGVQNFLNGTAVMPTFNVATLCGYFYYVGQSGDYVSIVSFHGDNTNPYYFLGVISNSDVSYAYTPSVNVVNGPTLTPGKWYFWVMQNDGANHFSAYLVEAGTALTTPTWSNLNIATANAAGLYINAYSNGLSPGIGFHARCRAWSSVLSLAELNAERVSAVAVKAGHTFDAALNNLSALDGLTITNTMIPGPGPGVALSGVGQTTTNGSNYLSRSTNLPTYNSMTVCGFFYYYSLPAADETMISVAYAAGAGHTWFGINSSYQVQGWDNTGGYTGVVLYPVERTWYFYVLQINGTTATYRAVPAGASITTASPQTITVPAAQTTSEIHSLQSNTLSSPATGYSARIRAWSSILNDTELDAERISATAVKAGSLFDAPLDSLSSLGGFTVNGTLTVGP